MFDVRGDADLDLRVAVVCGGTARTGQPEILVADRPVDPVVVEGAHLEIAGQESKTAAQPVPHRAAPATLVGAAEGQLRIALIEVSPGGVLPAAVGQELEHGRAGGVRIGRVRRLRDLRELRVEPLHVVLAAHGHVATRFEDEDLHAGCPQPGGDQRPRQARADDHDVVCSLVRHGRPPPVRDSPGLRNRRGAAAAPPSGRM